MACLVGTGELDEYGLPQVLPEDFEAACKDSKEGKRIVFARADVFPDAIQTSWRSKVTDNIPDARAEALQHIAGALGQLQWEAK